MTQRSDNQSGNPYELPADLPRPVDDGRGSHLRRLALAPISLPATDGTMVDLRLLDRAVLFFYPRTGVPGQPPGAGFQGESWDSIPGARGCTPQSCGFRDLHATFRSLGVSVLGVSTSSTEHQAEFKARNHVPFEFLSDHNLGLVRRMRLPTFEFPVSGGPTSLLCRMAWYVERDRVGVARIVKVWYPVFPPDQNAARVLHWLHRWNAVTTRAMRADDPQDVAFVREELLRNWGKTDIWSLGRRFDVPRLPAIIAELEGSRAGLVTYDINPGSYQCEVITLSVVREDLGVGAKLLHAVEQEARAAGCSRVFLTTSNDNIRAMAFYQKQGWRFSAVHRDNIDRARLLSGGFAFLGASGIESRDEIELDLMLEGSSIAPGG